MLAALITALEIAAPLVPAAMASVCLLLVASAIVRTLEP